MIYKTFTLEKASINYLASWNKRDEVIAIMKKAYNNSKEDKSWG